MLKLAGEVIEGQLADHQAQLDAHTRNMFQKMRLSQYIHPWMLTADGALALAADRIYAVPFIVARPLTIDRLAVEVTVEKVGKVARLGIYADGTDLYPGNLLKDYGTVSMEGIGVKTASADRSLSAGLYWLAVVSDDAPTLKASLQVCPPLGHRLTNLVLTNQYTHWYKDAVGSGALPDPFPSAAAVGNSYAPTILPRLKSLD